MDGYEEERTIDKLDEAYRQRGLVVIALGQVASANGFSVVRQERTEENWAVLYIELPKGQVSWHFKPEDEHMIEQFCIDVNKTWDGEFNGRNEQFMKNVMEVV